MISTVPQPTQQQSSTISNTNIIDQMAERMLEMGMNGTAVTTETLFEHSDFTRAEIKEHGPNAADLARTRAVRKVS